MGRTDPRLQDAGTPLERARIVDYIQGCARQGLEFNQALGVYSEWRRNYRLFRGGTEVQPQVSSGQWRSQVVPPEAFRAINTQVPRVVQGLYPHRQWFDTWSYSANRRYERMTKHTLLDVARRSKFIKESIPGVQMGAVLGHQIGEVLWDIDVEDEIRDIVQFDGSLAKDMRERVSFSGPKFRSLNPFKVLQDPTGQGMWWIKYLHTTLEAMHEVNRRYGANVYINLGQLSEWQAGGKGAGGPQGLGSHASIVTYSAETEGIEDIEGFGGLVGREPMSTTISLAQFWGYVPPHIVNYGQNGTQWRLVLLANNEVVVRDVEIPTHNGRPPMFNIPWIPIFGRLYGVSHLSYAAGLIDEITRIDRARMDELLMSIHPHTVINADAQWDNPNWVRQLGGISFVRGFGVDKPIANAIARFDTQPMLHNVWQERAAKRNLVDELMGSTPLFEGMPHSSRQTAEEIATLRTEGGMQSGLIAQWHNITLKAEYLERSWGMIRRFMDEAQVVRILGDEEASVLVNRDDLQDDIEIIIDVGMFGPWGQLQAGVLAQSLQFLGAEPFASWVKPREFFGDFIEHMGAPNSDRYLFTTAEMEQRQREAFEQQMALLQQQSMAEGAQASEAAMGAMG